MSLVKPQSASQICRMKQLDFAKHTEADETPSILRAENVKGTSGWREKAIWIIIIVSRCGFGYLAFCVH